MSLCFTVDMEDWYQGIGLPIEHWNKFEKRIKIGHYKLLNLLSKHKAKATYFLLGKVIEEFPELIQEIKDEGHELACHTYSHPFLYEITPQEFRNELKKCKELIAPFQDGYKGFRAPYFSIDNRNLWSLDILKQEGFYYDSSIFPGSTVRTGIPGFRKNIHTLPNNLSEIPLSNFKVFDFDFGVGGAYFRILPYWFFKNKVKEILTQRPVIFYIHPWELDAKQPYIKGLSRRIQYTHYFNLASTEKKLECLLSDFEFHSFKQILKFKDRTESVTNDYIADNVTK